MLIRQDVTDNAVTRSSRELTRLQNTRANDQISRFRASELRNVVLFNYHRPLLMLQCSDSNLEAQALSWFRKYIAVRDQAKRRPLEEGNQLIST